MLPKKVACPLCHAAVDQPCTVRTTNTVRTMVHHARWRRFADLWRSAPMRMEMREDDPHFGLSKGDVLICIKYKYDDKVTVIRRESDGYDPRCNQYTGSVNLLDFLPEAVLHDFPG
jgi:hypothetical protein